MASEAVLLDIIQQHYEQTYLEWLEKIFPYLSPSVLEYNMITLTVAQPHSPHSYEVKQIFNDMKAENAKAERVTQEAIAEIFSDG